MSGWAARAVELRYAPALLVRVGRSRRFRERVGALPSSFCPLLRRYKLVAWHGAGTGRDVDGL